MQQCRNAVTAHEIRAGFHGQSAVISSVTVGIGVTDGVGITVGISSVTDGISVMVGT